MSDDLTIQLFFWTSAILAGFEAMKAAGWRVWAFGTISALLGLIGILWSWLKQVYPPLTNAVADIATSPQSWFVLFVFGLVLISVTGRQRRAPDPIPAGFQPDDLARLQKIEAAVDKMPDRELFDLQINHVRKQQSDILQVQASQDRTMKLISASLERFKNLDRTAFLLTTAADQSAFEKKLRAALSFIEQHPRTGTFETDDAIIKETERVAEFFNDLRSNLAPSHWNTEFFRVLSAAENDADYELRKGMLTPEGLNPFQYRLFHIACTQYERVEQWLRRAIREAEAQDRQMQQMLRERPDLHK